jgi:hypothetical protein
MDDEKNKKLVEFYDKILEAERAGVQSTDELLRETTDAELKKLISSYFLDEGMNCGILSNLIKNTGRTPGNRTGDFIEKIRALKTVKEKLDLLVKGQEWVAKQIRYNREIISPASSLLFMEAIKAQHEENVDRLKKLIREKFPETGA